MSLWVGCFPKCLLHSVFELQNEVLDGAFTELPGGCIVSPEGTVLYGNRAPNPDQRLKLELYYTEPN